MPERFFVYFPGKGILSEAPDECQRHNLLLLIVVSRKDDDDDHDGITTAM
jgi:hypothetical protein